MSLAKLPRRLQAQFERNRAELLKTDIALQGSVTQRWMPCGKKGCRCQADPPQLHGPYYQWTAKIEGKTKTLRIKPEEVDLFRAWIARGRRLDALVDQWKKLSLEAVERSRKK